MENKPSLNFDRKNRQIEQCARVQKIKIRKFSDF